MALAIATIADSITHLTVAGLTIKDVDQIPEQADVRGHTIYPEPLNFVTDFTPTRDTFGGASAMWTVEYTLNYTLCYIPVGSERMGLDKYASMTALAFAFIDAVLAVGVLSGAVDIQPGGLSEFGVVSDPSGNAWQGCKIALRVKEFVN